MAEVAAPSPSRQAHYQRPVRPGQPALELSSRTGSGSWSTFAGNWLMARAVPVGASDHLVSLLRAVTVFVRVPVDVVRTPGASANGPVEDNPRRPRVNLFEELHGPLDFALGGLSRHNHHEH